MKFTIILAIALPLLAPAEGAAAAGTQFVGVAVYAVPADAAVARSFGFS